MVSVFTGSGVVGCTGGTVCGGVGVCAGCERPVSGLTGATWNCSPFTPVTVCGGVVCCGGTVGGFCTGGVVGLVEVVQTGGIISPYACFLAVCASTHDLRSSRNLSLGVVDVVAICFLVRV